MFSHAGLTRPIRTPFTGSGIQNNIDTDAVQTARSDDTYDDPRQGTMGHEHNDIEVLWYVKANCFIYNMGFGSRNCRMNLMSKY